MQKVLGVKLNSEDSLFPYSLDNPIVSCCNYSEVIGNQIHRLMMARVD